MNIRKYNIPVFLAITGSWEQYEEFFGKTFYPDSDVAGASPPWHSPDRPPYTAILGIPS
jgi:hypothetical protein